MATRAHSAAVRRTRTPWPRRAAPRHINKVVLGGEREAPGLGVGFLSELRYTSAPQPRYVRAWSACSRATVARAQEQCLRSCRPWDVRLPTASAPRKCCVLQVPPGSVLTCPIVEARPIAARVPHTVAPAGATLQVLNHGARSPASNKHGRGGSMVRPARSPAAAAWRWQI